MCLRSIIFITSVPLTQTQWISAHLYSIMQLDNCFASYLLAELRKSVTICSTFCVISHALISSSYKAEAMFGINNNSY